MDPAGDAATPLDEVDGRRARGARSREAIVEAILELLVEQGGQPGVEEIAARSGISTRSVFRHFDDLESLYAIAVEVQTDRTEHLWAFAPTSGSRDERVGTLVRHRARLYEELTPVRRFSERLRSVSAAIDERLMLGAAMLRTQLGEQFGSELASSERRDREDLLDALDAATSWSTWVLLRAQQGLSVARAERVVNRTVSALLA
jgi:AcrR family transcriptional regulator